MTTQEKREWLKAKAHFTLNDSSLSKWCRDNDTDLGSLRKAFTKKWEGPRARELVTKLKEEVRQAA